MSNTDTETNTAATTTRAPSAYAVYAAKARPVMDSLTFGIEIEVKTPGHGHNIPLVASFVARALGVDPDGPAVSRMPGDYYQSMIVTQADGRTWRIMTDSSVQGGCEIVSPIMRGLEEIKIVQEIARSVRRGGCKVDSDCGIHVHVGAKDMDAKSLSRLAKLVYSQEDLIIAGLGVASRTDGWTCKRVDDEFIAAIPRNPASVDAIGRAYYGATGRSVASECRQHYSQARYRGLNFHNLWFGPGGRARGTVEFRYFSGTLHGGKIRTAITLSLALVARAQLAKGGGARKRNLEGGDWSKYDMRLLGLRLGLMGEEFATTRLFLSANLGGSSRSANTGRKPGGVKVAHRDTRGNVRPEVIAASAAE